MNSTNKQAYPDFLSICEKFAATYGKKWTENKRNFLYVAAVFLDVLRDNIIDYQMQAEQDETLTDEAKQFYVNKCNVLLAGIDTRGF